MSADIREITDDTFVIRPHHLINMQNWLKSLFGAKTAALSFDSYYRWNGDPDIKLATDNPAEYAGTSRMDYVHDLMGRGAPSVDRHVAYLANIAHDFLTKPPETPVVVTLAADRICLEACVVGRHCTDMSPSESGHITRFMRDASELGIELGIADVDYVSTTLGAVRQVLQSRNQASH